MSADDILNSLDAGRQIQAAVTHAAAGLPWEPPLPLGDKAALPSLPVDAFPSWLAAMVAAVAEETQTPPDLAGCIALSVLSTAAGGRAVVNVRGSWTEPVNLFVVVAMPPASRKSPVFRAVTAPLLAAEKVLAEHADAAIVEAKLARRLAEQQADKTARMAAGNGGGTPESLAEAHSAALAVDSIEIPAKPRLIADDVTPEQAATLMSNKADASPYSVRKAASSRSWPAATPAWPTWTCSSKATPVTP